MPITRATRASSHPVYVRARQAALARPDLRFARAPAAPPALPLVTRLSNAPVRLIGSAPLLAGLLASSIPVEPPVTPPESPPLAPPQPEPAGPEITDIPPDPMPVPVREPPVMPQPIAAPRAG